MKLPVTAGVRFLRKHKIKFTEHLYNYEEHGGTSISARELGVSEHAVVKTLIMQTESGKPLVVLMHGDKKVSTKNLARFIDTKSVTPCELNVATRHSGYVVGGTSPFGLRKVMPIYMEKTILDLPKIYINGGARGYLVGIIPKILIETINTIIVNVANDGD
jgi:Cys-tRNA(Pro) deacylase